MEEVRYEALPTPVTPKSGEALTSLLDIIERVPNTEANSQHRERLQQKVSHAAQTFLAHNALLRDDNKFLTQANDESKPRRAVGSKKVGDGRIIVWKDVEQARIEDAEKKAKKAAKEARAATTGKKRGRPRKSATADTLEPQAKVARISETQIAQGEAGPSEPRTKVVQCSEARVEHETKPWRAPEAHMY
ncbi:uncharacterized protein BDR25DRAFT_288158 [Lindgomyces ingoldianus]|uniref:Uncharacterized protein n=1 Tax=Lindgomyces ingoldianus TaxID=673940 RepID=A0ACB6QT65_9PLEO|nr:uncharacterized protein BDR25DRAFT_288158 [Lindgomyces ingoldianus]KAF2469763.1 hypothetical protein BDR25DRAFT_288158 [Lindgomyces ingoldianus]